MKVQLSFRLAQKRIWIRAWWWKGARWSRSALPLKSNTPGLYLPKSCLGLLQLAAVFWVSLVSHTSRYTLDWVSWRVTDLTLYPWATLSNIPTKRPTEVLNYACAKATFPGRPILTVAYSTALVWACFPLQSRGCCCTKHWGWIPSTQQARHSAHHRDSHALSIRRTSCFRGTIDSKVFGRTLTDRSNFSIVALAARFWAPVELLVPSHMVVSDSRRTSSGIGWISFVCAAWRSSKGPA